MNRKYFITCFELVILPCGIVRGEVKDSAAVVYTYTVNGNVPGGLGKYAPVADMVLSKQWESHFKSK